LVQAVQAVEQEMAAQEDRPHLLRIPLVPHFLLLPVAGPAVPTGVVMGFKALVALLQEEI
jgi:hypothetical protein